MSKTDHEPMPVKRIINLMLLSGGVVAVLDLIIVKPHWLAHFIASSLVCCFGTAILCFYGLHPRSNFIGRNTKLARQSENTQRNSQRIIRFLVIGFAGFLVYFVDLPIMSDWAHFVHKGRPYFSEVEAHVDKNSMFFGTFFVNQTLDLTTETGQPCRSCFAMFFPRVVHYHVVYWFLIAPKSDLVLAWRRADSSAHSPAWK